MTRYEPPSGREGDREERWKEPSYVKTAKFGLYFSPRKLSAFSEVSFGFAVHTILSIKHKKGLPY